MKILKTLLIIFLYFSILLNQVKCHPERHAAICISIAAIIIWFIVLIVEVIELDKE